MNIVFFGSSDFSIPVLDALISSQDKVVKVVTTPDKPKGRGQKMSPTIVRLHAEEKKIPVIAPEKLKNPDVLAELEQLKPDFLVVASYGKLIPDSVLKIPKFMPLNVHPSLIPKYRGASPIQSAILAGDKKTGMTVMEVTSQLDAGDIFAQEETLIGENENTLELSARLAIMGGKLVLNVIKQFKEGKVDRKKQDESKATYANKMERNLKPLDWDQAAETIHNQVRAFYPWPGVFTAFNGKRVKILRTQLTNIKLDSGQPGTIVAENEKKAIFVEAKDKLLQVIQIQPEGKREMSAFEFAIGQHIKSGERFK